MAREEDAQPGAGRAVAFRPERQDRHDDPETDQVDDHHGEEDAERGLRLRFLCLSAQVRPSVDSPGAARPGCHRSSASSEIRLGAPEGT